jgi:hypothetical protein
MNAAMFEADTQFGSASRNLRIDLGLKFRDLPGQFGNRIVHSVSSLLRLLGAEQFRFG